jgi:hypothetical protein
VILVHKPCYFFKHPKTRNVVAHVPTQERLLGEDGDKQSGLTKLAKKISAESH